MLRAKKKPENALENVNYSFPKIGKAKLIPAFVCIFLLAFILNFPLMEIVKNKIKTQLSRIPGCSLTVKDINFGILLPKIELNQLNIPKRCAGKALFLDQLKIYFRGPSFSPIGIATKIETDFEGIPVEAYASLGVSSQIIKLDDMKLALSEINKRFPLVKVNGDVSINAIVEIANNRLGKVNALIESKNFTMPVQNIKGFTLPNMNINSLKLKISQKSKRKMVLEDFVIGDLDSPIRANFKGDITPNSSNFLFSRINLQGEVAFGQSIKDNFGILLNFFNAFPTKDKFYQMRLQGTVGQPLPKPL